LIILRVFLLGMPFVVHEQSLPRVFVADAARYHQIATAPGRPYRDFDVEFPPVSLGAIEVAAGSSPRQTALRLGILELALDLLTAGALFLGWGAVAALSYLAIGTLLVPFVYFRIDLLSVVLAVMGFLLVRRDRARLGGLMLALAVLAKVWPLVLAPVLVIERRFRALLWFLAALAAGSLLWIWWGGADAPIQVLTFRRAHGWQIESTVATVLRVVSSPRVFSDAGADRVGTAPVWARVLLLTVAAGVIAMAARWTSRHREQADGVYPVTALAALLVAAPVLSPQYLTWLFPWVGIAVARNERIQAELLGFAALLTMGVLYNYGFLFEGRAAFTWMALLRNLVLMAIVAVGLWRLAGHRLEAPVSTPES
jgi:Glycosyltransferase family 87